MNCGKNPELRKKEKPRKWLQRWLGRQDSNLRMLESKSEPKFRDLKALADILVRNPSKRTTNKPHNRAGQISIAERIGSRAAHSNNFDALRLIASLLVVFSHVFSLTGRHEPTLIGSHHSLGNLGVLIFFSISGYLVSASWAEDPHAGRFLARRALRLLPGAIVAVAAMYAFLSLLGLAGGPPENTVFNPFHLQAFQGNVNHLFNGPLWTLPFEAFCYLILMTIGLIVRKPGLYMAAIFLCAWEIHGEVARGAFLVYFGLFFCAGALVFHFPALRSPRSLCVLFVSGAYLCSGGQTITGLALIVPAATIAIGLQSWPVLRDCAMFGDLSYGIYVYAWPVQQLLIHWLGKDSNYLVLVTPCLAVTLLLAALSWKFVEAPALSLKPGRSVTCQSSSPRDLAEQSAQTS